MRNHILGQGDHICAVYESPDEQLQVLGRYIKAGLDEGERCLYIVDDRSADDVLDAMSREGVDVRPAQANRRLVLLTKRESYLNGGSFDPDAMIWALAARTDEALAEGCSGLRSRFQPEIIRDVLRLHPCAIIGESIYPSPFYEPPNIARLSPGDPRRVDYMLTQMKSPRE